MEWRPIETAPPPGTTVLISGFIRNDPTQGRWVSQATQDEDLLEWWVTVDSDYGGESFYPPTHWMPLPDPPGEQHEEN